ncbi:MAG: DUF354 domain-containing protein [Actinomycetota bacterium]|nr:DUF354 domain-containing protein [Actinomycetota bacterium]
MTRSGSTDVWIDLSNSPHVPLFAPVVKELRRRGITVTLTARDLAQTLELAHREFSAVEVIEGWSPGMAAKATALARRAAALMRYARRRCFRLAVSHNSYAQLLAARLVGIPALTMMDYEHQPANHLAFRLAQLVVVPEVFPEEALSRCGARRVHRYPGLKEEVYLGTAHVDEDLRARLGIGNRVLVVLRPPPDAAIYHRFENPLFAKAVDRVLTEGDTVALMVPRTPAQATSARERWGDRVLAPNSALPGESLLLAADVVVGAGGTMNREAALLGTPTYSVFAGKPSAVDAHLTARGMLTPLQTESDLDQIRLERKPFRPHRSVDPTANPTLQEVVSAIMQALTS